jgi:uncharacterized protein YccT (UPF0319 family)
MKKDFLYQEKILHCSNLLFHIAEYNISMLKEHLLSTRASVTAHDRLMHDACP